MFFILDIVTSALAVILVAGLRDDSNLEGSLSVDNSHIIMQTKRIDRVVALGPIVLKPLIQEMNSKETSLDSFARCYSSCDQILRKAGLKEAVDWHGGLITTERKSGRVVGVSLIDGDNVKFRQKQVEEIVRRAKELEIDLSGSR